MKLENVCFVLHRPSSAENVGAAARALKNFGFGRLTLVEPRSWSGPGREDPSKTGREDFLARAGRLARRASDLLEKAEVHLDMKAALAPMTWACGTTSRSLDGRPPFSPRALAREVARRSALGPVAVVFGEERRGLSDGELELCQAVCTVPTHSAYDSMNLAQAVAVLAYELSGAAVPDVPLPGIPEVGGTAVPDVSNTVPDVPIVPIREGVAVAAVPDVSLSIKEWAEVPSGVPARHATTEALWDRLKVLLQQVGYLNPQNPEQILAEWRRFVTRAEPTQREVELLLAAVRSIQRAVGER